MSRKRVYVTLPPSDQNHLDKFCKKTGQKEGTVVTNIFHATKEGLLLKPSGKNYFDID